VFALEAEGGGENGSQVKTAGARAKLQGAAGGGCHIRTTTTLSQSQGAETISKAPKNNRCLLTRQKQLTLRY
jgi:mevalonate kinase